MSALCLYFLNQDSVSENPELYFSKSYEHSQIETSYKHSFFYPHIYLKSKFGNFNYSLDSRIYQSTFVENCKNLISCILRSPADSDAFQSGRCAEHNGRPESPIIVS